MEVVVVIVETEIETDFEERKIEGDEENGCQCRVGEGSGDNGCSEIFRFSWVCTRVRVSVATYST